MAETFQWSPKHVLVNFREYLQTDTEGEKIIPSTCFSWNMCVGGVFRFLVIYLGSETQTIAIRIKKRSLPIIFSQPLSPALLSLFPWQVGGGHLSDGWAFATLWLFLHKRLLHYFKTDFYFFVCARALTRTTILLVVSTSKWPISKGDVGWEGVSNIPVQYRHGTTKSHHQTVEVTTCGGRAGFISGITFSYACTSAVILSIDK